MDKIWYLAFLFNALAVSAMGQQNLQAMFKLGFPSTSNQAFFAEHPDIVRIVIDYKSEVPTSVAFVRHPEKEQDRKSVGKGKSVSVSVDIGGRSIIKKKKIK